MKASQGKHFDTGRRDKDLAVHLKCPYCNDYPPNLVYPSSHETVCGSCGFVLGDREIDTRPEYRTFFSGDLNNDYRQLVAVLIAYWMITSLRLKSGMMPANALVR